MDKVQKSAYARKTTKLVRQVTNLQKIVHQEQQRRDAVHLREQVGVAQAAAATLIMDGSGRPLQAPSPPQSTQAVQHVQVLTDICILIDSLQHIRKTRDTGHAANTAEHEAPVLSSDGMVDEQLAQSVLAAMPSYCCIADLLQKVVLLPVAAQLSSVYPSTIANV
jgi:hypothetical protein